MNKLPSSLWLVNIVDILAAAFASLTLRVTTATWSSLRFALNKAPFALLLWGGFRHYNSIVAAQASRELGAMQAGLAAPAPLAFLEIYYAALSVGVAVLLAFVIRLGVFPETAEYAETGELREDLRGVFMSPRLIHYWFATAICFAAVLFCLSNLPK